MISLSRIFFVSVFGNYDCFYFIYFRVNNTTYYLKNYKFFNKKKFILHEKIAKKQEFIVEFLFHCCTCCKKLVLRTIISNWKLLFLLTKVKWLLYFYKRCQVTRLFTYTFQQVFNVFFISNNYIVDKNYVD